jgi:N-carbamoyl-L-amino-acid hydrolase
VIPGKVVMSLELRDLSSEKVDSLFQSIQTEANAIAQETGTKISFAPIPTNSIPALTDERVRKVIAESARELGLSFKLMPSGAGHDAQDMARIAPAGMIFVTSVGGISHSPKEFTRSDDMANGVNVLLQTLLKIDQGALD